MYQTVRPLIFRLPPERAHNLTIQLLRFAGAQPAGRVFLRAMFRPVRRGPEVKAFGLTFPNPVGMAAGYDKDGLAWRGLAELGFGHIEVGTVTTLPQSGAPQPRVFRLVEEQAVINRMGFPNRGSEFLVRRLQARRPKGLILGVNIGKHISTPLEEATNDYLSLLRIFAPLSDYLTINVSSPNTPGLRNLQARGALQQLLAPLDAERKKQVVQLGRPVPLLVKLAPDLAPSDLDDAVDVILAAGMDGIVASNTTIRRPEWDTDFGAQRGGLSGAPIRRLNTEFLQRISQRTEGKLPIIASGGIMSPEDVQEKLDAGATMIQLYTGLIYSGPGLVKRVLDEAFSTEASRKPATAAIQPGHSGLRAGLTYFD